MKVLEINSVCGIGSTGRICTDIAEVLIRMGDECAVGYGRAVGAGWEKIAVPIGGTRDVLLHGIGSRLFDNTGFYSTEATRKFLDWMDDYCPDLIHLHNIHGYYLNIELLFQYLKARKIPVVWTLHDCWAFTGHCSHFVSADCEKWKEACGCCPMKKEYPGSWILDNSLKNFRRKKELFCGVEKLRIVTPSDWLKGCVEQSFLGAYPVQTIRNGVDLTKFRPMQSDIMQKYGLQNKKVVLGVASAWTEHKGLSMFLRLADLLDDSCRVVLVGVSDAQKKRLPPHVTGICRTDRIEELAQLYTEAYVHVSMSREETMGLTIVEANACGTPAVVFDSTALPEIVTPQTGLVLREHTPEAVAYALEKSDFSKRKYSEACIAHAEKFEKQAMYSEYIRLYRSLVP